MSPRHPQPHTSRKKVKADSRISPLLGGGTGGLREAHHGIDAQHGLAIHQLLDPRLGHVWGFRKRDCAFAELLARAFEGARHGISTVAVRERIVTPDQLMTMGTDEHYEVTAGKAAPRQRAQRLPPLRPGLAP